MLWKTVSGIMLTLFVTSLLTFTLSIQLVKADYIWTETIYIRADGSIEPYGAPISTGDNVTYVLTDNIVDAAPLGDDIAIFVRRNDIVLDGAGYTLQGSNASQSTGVQLGIRLARASNVTIKNMTIKHFYFGVDLRYGVNNTISGNTITNNNWISVYLYFGYNNIVSGNTIKNNKYYGVAVYYSSGNTFSGNVFVDDGLYISDSYDSVVVDNVVNGKPLVYLEDVSDMIVEDAGQVILVNCNHITVYSLNLSHTTVGVQLLNTNNTSITGNTMTANNWFGVELHQSFNNTVPGNTITNNVYGVWLWESFNNTISGNTITNNDCGIYLRSSSNNRFYHNNLIDNTQQICFYTMAGYANNWDDGFPSGGNYWNDYEDKYPNATEIDGSDIWDTPYFIDENNQDNYPIIPEFSHAMLLLLLILATLLIVTFARAKRETTTRYPENSP